MDFYVTLLGSLPLTAKLPVDLGDGYEMKLIDIRIPQTRFKAFKSKETIEFRLEGEKLHATFPGGHFETVADVCAYLNHLLKSRDKDNTITFVFDKFLQKVQVRCTGRASVLLSKELSAALGLPHTTLRNTFIGDNVSYDIGRGYGLVTCDALEQSVFNQQRLPLLTACYLDEKTRRIDGYKKLRKIKGENTLKIELRDTIDQSPIWIINGECLMMMHVRKCT